MGWAWIVLSCAVLSSWGALGAWTWTLRKRYAAPSRWRRLWVLALAGGTVHGAVFVIGALALGSVMRAVEAAPVGDRLFVTADAMWRGGPAMALATCAILTVVGAGLGLLAIGLLVGEAVRSATRARQGAAGS